MARSPNPAPTPGRYRIKTVARLTGVDPALLRAWETRYGVPRPSRTDSAYRSYTDADIAMVRQLRDLRDSGLSASEAAQLVVKTQAEREVAAPLAGGMAERLVDAARRLDGLAIEQILTALTALGGAEEAFDRVLAPALAQIGEAWRAGELNEGHEHLLSDHVAGALRAWTGLARAASPRGAVVVACFADELHSIPAYGFALRLATWGYAPTVLGARTPPSAVAVAVKQLAPVLVALSVTMPVPRSRHTLIAEYGGACGRTPWIVGGAGAERLSAAVVSRGGVVAPAQPVQQQTVIEALVASAGGTPPSPMRSRRGAAAGQ
jgi:DNA-binding transcriptional MerR regulator